MRKEAIARHTDWFVIASDEIASQMEGFEGRKISDNDVFLLISLRADFIDCSRWVEQAIGRRDAALAAAQRELAKLQKTSMRICVTRDMARVRARVLLTRVRKEMIILIPADSILGETYQYFVDMGMDVL